MTVRKAGQAVSELIHGIHTLEDTHPVTLISKLEISVRICLT